jgi:acyl-coenzyme A synthetase/AMP-(fatty) acid ligase
VGKPFSNVDIDIRQPQPPMGTGQIFVRSPMLFMDYVGASQDSTAAVRDGDWLSVRDMGYLDAQGYLYMVGRENRMVVTQGKNLFPEEVESVLLSLPEVTHASVLGMPDPIRGQQVVAIVNANAQTSLTAHTLSEQCRKHLESYKVPKRFFVCNDWVMTASGKTDHAALAVALEQHLDNQETQPCFHPLH